jgi:catechol 2,3-dioxygenase-like lactoylglutathione lyase family enzyme
MGIEGFDHYTVRAKDYAVTRHFYEETLGLQTEDRPGANIPAALVFIGGQAMVHLFQATDDLQAIFGRLTPPDEETANWATGRMHHIALRATGLPEMRQRLSAAGVSFTERTIAAMEKHLIVLKDPDGVELEIQFPSSEVS